MTPAAVIWHVEYGDLCERLRAAESLHAISRIISVDRTLARAIAAKIPRTRFIERAYTILWRIEPAGYAHTGDLPLCAYAYLLTELDREKAAPFLRRLASQPAACFPAASELARVLLL